MPQSNLSENLLRTRAKKINFFLTFHDITYNTLQCKDYGWQTCFLLSVLFLEMSLLPLSTTKQKFEAKATAPCFMRLRTTVVSITYHDSIPFLMCEDSFSLTATLRDGQTTNAIRQG